MKLIRSLKLLILVVAIIIPFQSCSKSDDEPTPEPTPLPYMEIEKVVYEISAEAQTFDVLIKTNIKLNVKYIEDSMAWISVSIAKEEGENVTYAVTVIENKGTDMREGMVVFKPVDGTFIPKDSQMGSNTITILQDGIKP